MSDIERRATAAIEGVLFQALTGILERLQGVRAALPDDIYTAIVHHVGQGIGEQRAKLHDGRGVVALDAMGAALDEWARGADDDHQ